MKWIIVVLLALLISPSMARAERPATQPSRPFAHQQNPKREVSRRMVQKSLDQRREKIEKLRKLLDEQEKQLDQDDKNKEQLMKQQFTEAVNKFERLFGVGGKDRGPMDRSDGRDGQDVNAL